MNATIYGPETWEGEVDCTVTWSASVSRNFGSAELRFPRGSSIADLDSNGNAKYLYQDGGFYVELNHRDLGVWRGIADTPTINRMGVTIPCMEIETLVSIRRVSAIANFEAVSAGHIVKAAFEQAFGAVGAAFLSPGTFDLSGPLILSYQFNAQYLSEVLGAMMDWTGMEWWVDEQLHFHWGMGGKFYPYPLSDDGDVLESERSGTIQEMAVEVTATNSLGMERTFMNMDDPAGILWPRQVVV